MGGAQTLLDSEMGQLLGTTQEISVLAPRVALALRPGIGEWRREPRPSSVCKTAFTSEQVHAH